MRTLLIVNPTAKGGKALATFRHVEPRLAELLGEVEVTVTECSAAVADCVESGLANGVRRVIAVGGDGTNNAVVSALAKRPGCETAFGSVPIGTGGDWARALGIPSDPVEALRWLACAEPVRCDLGRVEIGGAGVEPSTRFFLNISSAGVSGDVVARVNRQTKKSAASFLSATLRALLTFQPAAIRVVCDGVPFYEGGMYMLAVANGRDFGRGMKIAPKALIDDGLFDVVLVRGAWRPVFFLALPRVFLGTHLTHSAVRYTRAAKVQLESASGILDLDLDGENGRGSSVTYTVLPRAISVLVHPSTAPLASH